MAFYAILDPETGFLEEFENWLGKKHFGRERGEILLLLFIVVYTVTLSSLSVYRHYAYNTHAWDLGIFTQSLWTTLNTNRFLYYTCELIVNPSGSFFGVHFSPILGFILPLYGIFQSPETLLVLQSFILPLATIPIYKLAREKSGKRAVGLVFALAYLMYPPIHHVNVYEFHVQAFLPLFFGYTIYSVSKEDWSKYFIFVFLSLMCEEHVAWIVFFIGVYVGWTHRKEIIEALKKKAFTNRNLIVTISTMTLSLVWYWFTLWQRDTFFPVNPATMTEFLGSGNFRILGASNPLEVPLFIILRPWNAIQALAYDGPLKLAFIVFMFGPLAFLSLKSPSSLLPAVPSFIFSLFSQSSFHHILGTQYPAYFAFFIFGAAIFGLDHQRSRKIKRSLKVIMASSLAFFICVSPFFPTVDLLPTDYNAASIGDHERSLDEVLRGIPANASILTQDNIFPHVSHRVDAYVIPDRWIHSGGIREIAVEFVNQTMDRVEYVLVDNKTDFLAYELVLLLLSAKPQFSLEVSQDNGTIILYHQELP
jgi:uncharacterized membrane protein